MKTLMPATTPASTPILRQLIEQVEVMVAESGNPEGFRAADWVSGWLETPNPSLDGKCPSAYVDQPGGPELLSRLLAQMQSSAYA
jgi:hypothetical protein